MSHLLVEIPQAILQKAVKSIILMLWILLIVWEAW